jgi:23S rRNA (guanine2445-N2)-methyltransferase / 23S rRNA (guanine2069-N7)-methyltransferase
MSAPAPAPPSEGARTLANRLRKNQKRLSRWLKRESIHCYRLYDADIPEYALAIDIYQGERRWVHAQEYQAPRSIDPEKAQKRLQEALQVIREVLEVPEPQLFLKVRQQQKGNAQYQPKAGPRYFHQVIEGGHRFLVNFDNYLDTGLFLDHSITRAMLGRLAQGRDFLNLFAYTGSASVYAGSGGAASTTTLDMSKTYTEWARRNMALNGLRGKQHRLIQADCLAWLKSAAGKQRYGLIFLDPPSFSASQRMQGTFDVQRDHVRLIRAASRLLTDDGTLIFSNNLRRFRMDQEALSELTIEDISRRTLPTDFKRNPRIHNCWRINSCYCSDPGALPI